MDLRLRVLRERRLTSRHRPQHRRSPHHQTPFRDPIAAIKVEPIAENGRAESACRASDRADDDTARPSRPCGRPRSAAPAAVCPPLGASSRPPSVWVANS